ISILGMVNTLTISLLERTKEVGLMKTVGMNADEIRALFINESMLIGFTGGVLGVVIGVCLGLGVSLLLSVISISNGGNSVGISFLPVAVGMFIILLSTFIGFLTGLYPSERAARIAPLDA